MPEFIWELPAIRPAPVEESAPGEGAIDHATAAVNRLPQQFRKPKIEALVRIFCAPMAALEQAFIDLLTKRTVETAEGEQLNVLGRIVGQRQVNVTDTTYRSLIRARIRANKSSGMGDQILLVVRLVLSDYASQTDVAAAGTMRLRLIPYGRASYVIEVEDMDLPWDLADLLVDSFLSVISAAGLRVSLHFAPQNGVALDAYDGINRFGSVSDGTVGAKGFGSVSDATVGGPHGAAVA